MFNFRFLYSSGSAKKSFYKIQSRIENFRRKKLVYAMKYNRKTFWKELHRLCWKNGHTMDFIDVIANLNMNLHVQLPLFYKVNQS